MRNRKVIGIIVAFCFLVVVSSLWILLRGDSNEEQWSEVTNSTVYHLTDGEAQYRSPYYKDLAAAIKAEKIFKRVEAKVIVHKVKMILITNRVYRALDKNGRELYFDETSETNLGVYLEFRARTLAEVGRDLAGGFKFKITRPKAIEREGVKQIFRFFENPLVSKGDIEILKEGKDFTIVKSGDYDGEYKQKLLNITHDNGSYQNSYSQCHRVIEWNKRCARLLNLNGDNGAVYPAIEAVSYFKASIEWREMFKNLPYPLDKSRHYFDVSEIIVDGNIYKVHYVYSQAYGAEIVAVLATTKAPVTVVFEVRRPVQIDKDGEQITYFYDLPSYTSEFDWMLNHYLKEVVMKK